MFSSFFFPACALCGKRRSLDDSPGMFCKECLAEMPLITGKKCPVCGGFLTGIFDCCSDCLAEGARPWDKAYAVFSYEGRTAEAVRLFKFGKCTALARPFGRFLAGALPGDVQYDGIVPVPLHWFRFLQRGYNQSVLLAEEMSKHTGIPVAKVLLRTRFTKHQAFLNREDRLKNIVDAFAVRKNEDIRGRRLLLLDDVMTTGTTLAEAARVLKNAGAAVDVIVLARRQRN